MPPPAAPARPRSAAGPAYEVTYRLAADDAAVAGLRRALLALGDSLVLAGGDGEWRVHVHVDDVAAAIEAGLAAGRPHQLGVVRFADQPGHVEPDGPESDSPEPEALEPRRRAVLAVAEGDGTARLFTDLGAQVVMGPLPSRADLVRAIERTGAAEVLLFGNDARLSDAVRDAAEATRSDTRSVAVVPTRSPLQGLVALSVADPGRRFADDVIAAAQAAAACRCGAVVVRGGRVHTLVDGGRETPARDATTAALDVAGRLAALGGERLTVLLGRDAPPRLAERLRDAHPELELELLDGGQADPVVALGVE